MRDFIFYSKGDKIPEDVKKNLEFIERKVISVESEGYGEPNGILSDSKRSLRKEYMGEIAKLSEELDADVVKELEYRIYDLGYLKKEKFMKIFSFDIHKIKGVGIVEAYRLSNR